MNDKLRQLEERVHRLETLLEKAKVFEPYIPEDLAQGEDDFLVLYQVYQPASDGRPDYPPKIIQKETMGFTWNELFTEIAPCLMIEASFGSIEKKLKQSIYKYLRLDELYDLPNPLVCIEILADDVRTIILQFRALNLIRESGKKHSVTDDKEYWSLTKYGQDLMLKLSTIKREN